MKTLKTFWALMLCIPLLAGFTACSDDDDEGGATGKATATVDGSSVNLVYAHYYKNYNEMIIELFSCNPFSGSIPSTYSYVWVSYNTSSSTVESVTIPAGSYSVEMEKDWPTTEGKDVEPYYFTDHSWTGSDSDLVITKDGSTYTINIASSTLRLETDYFVDGEWQQTVNDPTPHSFSLSYTGSIVPAPDEYLE